MRDWLLQKGQIDFGNFAVGIATALIAIVTLVVSLRNINSGQRQKIAEFRRAWIEELRGKIVRFSRIYALLHLECSEVVDLDGNPARVWKEMNREQMESLNELTELRYYIDLMLNPKEEPHQRLMTMMDSFLSGSADVNIRQFHDLARQIMKSEWDRVTKSLT
jgi:hypothetical protein